MTRADLIAVRTAGTLGPLLGVWLYDVIWAMALWLYAATLVPMAIGGLMMAHPGRYLEDKVAV